MVAFGAPLITVGDVSGGFVAGGDPGERGPTVVTFPGGLDTLSRLGGNCRGAGVIWAGLVTPARPAVELRPVVKGSGAIRRGGILEVGEVRPGSVVRLLMAGSGFGGLPIPGSGLGWLTTDGSGLAGGLPIPSSGCF